MLTLYETFYKLSADPFRLSPDHRFSFGHRSYAKAKAYLEYALHRGEGFITITGNAGTGKTTLISEILAELDKARLQVANLNSTQLEGKDLLQMVAALFGLEYEDESKASLLLEIEEFLKQLSQKGRRAVLIVDEAQGLSPSAVEELRLLANLQFNHRLLLQVFLVGQEQLRDMVRAPGMEHLRQRIVAASHLEALTLDETISYIEHRLLRVGWQGDPALSEDALRLVHRFSAGVPRRINLICSRLFLFGSMEQKHELDGVVARTVIEDLQQELLVSPEAVDQQEAGEPGSEQGDGAEAPVRRLPRAKQPVQPVPATESSAQDLGELLPSDTGPGGAEGGTGRERDIALRERDIWGEIEHLEKELQSASSEFHDAEVLHASQHSVAATAAITGQASRRAAQPNTVGAAVSKAMSRGRATGASAQQSGKQPRIVAKRVREVRPRFQAVSGSTQDASVADEETRPQPRTERGDAVQGVQRHTGAATPPRKRRWSVLVGMLVIGLVGLAGTFGWQNRDRLSFRDPANSGTIQRDTDVTEHSSGPENETGTGAVISEAQELEAVAQGGEDTSAIPAPLPGGVEAGQPSVDAESVQGETAVSATDRMAVAESGLSAGAGVAGDTPSAGAEKRSSVTGSGTDAINVAEKSDDAAAVPAVTETTATGDAERPSRASVVPAGGAPDSLDSVEAERERLRREAEQRFDRQLGQSETQATRTDAAASPPVRKAADKVPAAKTETVSAATPDAKRSETRSSVPSTPAPAVSMSSVPASRPKTVSAPTQLASAPANLEPESEPEFNLSPEQVRSDLLQGQWTSQGKPATLLPSEITFCSAAAINITCWSAPQKTDTKYGKALYKVEARLDGFGADGGFRLTYRTLVKLLESEEVSDTTALGRAADDDAGWQVTERTMECELIQGDSVQCRGANGIVRDYRKVVAGNEPR